VTTLPETSLFSIIKYPRL